MLYDLVDCKNKICIARYLCEAEQDSDFQLLSEYRPGLVSFGMASCYAIVIKSANNVALVHLSDVAYLKEYIDDMIKGVSQEAQPFEILIARSFRIYEEAIASDLIEHQKKGIPYEPESPADYFSGVDQEYRNFLNDYYDIEPQFIELPHDFLIIDSQGNLHLGEEYSPNQVGFVPSVKLAYRFHTPRKEREGARDKNYSYSNANIM